MRHDYAGVKAVPLGRAEVILVLSMAGTPRDHHLSLARRRERVISAWPLLAPGGAAMVGAAARRHGWRRGAPPLLAPRRAAFVGAAARRLCSFSYTPLRSHDTKANLLCRLLLEKKKKQTNTERDLIGPD